MNQLTSPQNAGLFQGAIVESGVSANVYPAARRFGMTPKPVSYTHLDVYKRQPSTPA